MGWFSKAKASGHFGALRGAIAEKLRVRLAPGTEEVFEIIDDLWRKLMEENGRQMLSLRPFSMAYTIYPALPEVSADKRPDILAGMIAFLLIKDFKETKHAHELDYILAPLQTTFQREGSSSLDNSFRKLNPRSYAAIVRSTAKGHLPDWHRISIWLRQASGTSVIHVTMSRIVEKQVRCPKCDSVLSVKVYETLNVGTDPALKPNIFDKSLNAHRCPRCKTAVMVACDLLYHDPIQKFMVWLRLNEYQELSKRDFPEANISLVSRRAFASYRLRLTDGWTEFLERIRILDEHLDEGTIEALKFVIWDQIPENAGIKYIGRNLNFRWADDSMEEEARLYFDFAATGSSRVVGYPRAMYENVRRDSQKLNPKDGIWTHLNFNYMTGQSM